MGKTKGSWFSTIKKIFTHSSSSDKPSSSIIGSSDKKSSKEKKKSRGFLSETKSFIPLFREPSSIEKILGEADQLFIRPPTPFQPPILHPPALPNSPKATSPRVSSARNSTSQPLPEPAFTPDPFSSKTAPSPKPVSSYTAPAPKPVSSNTAPSPKPVSSNTAPSPKPVSSYTAPSPKPVTSNTAPSPKPVSSNTVTYTKPVSSNTAPSPKPVTSSTAPSEKPVSSNTVPSTKPVSSYTAPSPKPVSSYTAPAPNVSSNTAHCPKPVSSYTSPAPEPVSSNTAPSPKPVTSNTAPSPKPVSSNTVPSTKPVSSRAFTHEKAASSKTISSPKITENHKEISYVKQRAEPTLTNQNLSATKIQAAYRGYMGRRSFRALKGLIRLQGVVRGQNVKRQTMNAMKQMQLLVRVQTQIQSRRIQMLENHSHRHDKDAESSISKWTFNQLSEAGNNEDWDNSVLTKEEVDERLQKKVEAVIRRERAMAYAYSHKLWKANPKSAQGPPDNRSNGYPWWWNWLERQIPAPSISHQSETPSRNIMFTPPRPVSEYKSSPLLKHRNFTFDNHHEAVTPRSSRSLIPARAKQFHSPSRTPPTPSTSSFIKYSKPRRGVASSLRDDDSLASCPPFSVPNYMSPTVSAKAKVRTISNLKERFMGTPSPSNDSKRRFSFPLTPNIGPFKWNRGSNKDTASQGVSGKHRSSSSIGDMSLNSAVSMPALVGRKPFNRFV